MGYSASSRGHVPEDLDLLSLHDGDHPSGDGRFDVTHRRQTILSIFSPAPAASCTTLTILLQRARRAPALIHLYQVQHLRQNTDGGTAPLVDSAYETN